MGLPEVPSRDAEVLPWVTMVTGTLGYMLMEQEETE